MHHIPRAAPGEHAQLHTWASQKIALLTWELMTRGGDHLEGQLAWLRELEEWEIKRAHLTTFAGRAGLRNRSGGVSK
jgi:hypothetical protein